MIRLGVKRVARKGDIIFKSKDKKFEKRVERGSLKIEGMLSKVTPAPQWLVDRMEAVRNAPRPTREQLDRQIEACKLGPIPDHYKPRRERYK